MITFPIANPTPDFKRLKKIIKGDMKADRVHFVEFLVDEEIMQYITENYFQKKWLPDNSETREQHLQQIIDFYYNLGYDFVPLAPAWVNLPDFNKRLADDTAQLSRGKRSWVEEGEGIIKNWDDFKKINWDQIKPDFWQLEYVQNHLPAGMKVTIYNTVFQMVLENFLGYEDLFLFSYDKPELVEAIFESWGRVVYRFYQKAVTYTELGAIFHADDMGYKTGTMLSPDFLRKNVFGWLQKYADLAHEKDKMFWLHSCGNLRMVFRDLIDDIKIDAFHSFQDNIMPVQEFIDNYQVAALGGVDMDKLVRLPETELRQYIQNILANCNSSKFILGSGNTIANYVPPENYLIMLEEGHRWE